MVRNAKTKQSYTQKETRPLRDALGNIIPDVPKTPNTTSIKVSQSTSENGIKVKSNAPEKNDSKIITADYIGTSKQKDMNEQKNYADKSDHTITKRKHENEDISCNPVPKESNKRVDRSRSSSQHRQRNKSEDSKDQRWDSSDHRRKKSESKDSKDQRSDTSRHEKKKSKSKDRKDQRRDSSEHKRKKSESRDSNNQSCGSSGHGRKNSVEYPEHDNDHRETDKNDNSSNHYSNDSKSKSQSKKSKNRKSNTSNDRPGLWRDTKNNITNTTDSIGVSNSICRVEELKGDLFDADDSFSLAHCVAEDMGMGAGIAVEFRERFKKTGYLKDLGVAMGGVAILPYKGRFIYYLVTKKLSKGKPTMKSLENSLKKMAEHVMKNDVKKIAMPQIGCGLDRLDWSAVLFMIKNVFSSIDVHIRIYQYAKSEPTAGRVLKKCTFVNHLSGDLINTEPNTALLYFSEDTNNISPQLKQLDEKHSIVRKHLETPKKIGDVVRIITQMKEVAYGLVCKDGEKILFECLEEKCLANLRKLLVEDKYEHIGIQALENEMVMSKVLNVLKYGIQNHIKIWVYWGGNVPNQFIDWSNK